MVGYEARTTRQRGMRSWAVPIGVGVAVIGAWLVWLGFQPPMIEQPETQSVRDPRTEVQIWGFALTFIVVVAVASWFATRAGVVANSAAGALLLVYYVDVARGPSSEGWAFGLLLWGMPIVYLAHLVATYAHEFSPAHRHPESDPAQPDS